MITFPELCLSFLFFFFNDTATTEIYTLSLHDALPISSAPGTGHLGDQVRGYGFVHDGTADTLAHFFTVRVFQPTRSEEHTSELQSRPHLVCRLLLEKKKKKIRKN